MGSEDNVLGTHEGRRHSTSGSEGEWLLVMMLKYNRESTYMLRFVSIYIKYFFIVVSFS